MNIISHSHTVAIWNFALQIILCAITCRCLLFAKQHCSIFVSLSDQKWFAFSPHFIMTIWIVINVSLRQKLLSTHKWIKQVACTRDWGLHIMIQHSTKWDQTWSTLISFKIARCLQYITLRNCLSAASRLWNVFFFFFGSPDTHTLGDRGHTVC